MFQTLNNVVTFLAKFALAWAFGAALVLLLFAAIDLLFTYGTLNILQSIGIVLFPAIVGFLVFEEFFKKTWW